MTRNHCDSSKIELKLCEMRQTFLGDSSGFNKLYSAWDETLSQEWQSLIKDDQMAAWSPIMTAPRWSRLERLDQGFHLATTSQEIRDQGPATNPLVQLHSKFNIAPSQNPKLKSQEEILWVIRSDQIRGTLIQQRNSMGVGWNWQLIGRSLATFAPILV